MQEKEGSVKTAEKETAKRPRPRTWSTRQMVFVAMLVCLAMVLSYIERLLPLSFTIPGIKLGLANLVVLTGIYILSFRQALVLVVLKCVMTAWIFGSFSAFLYSVVGTLLSFLVMEALVNFGELWRGRLTEKEAAQTVQVGRGGSWGTIVVSVVGAVFHNIGQILAAAVIVHSGKVFYYLPVLLVAGVLTGLLIGFGVRATLPYVKTLKEVP